MCPSPTDDTVSSLPLWPSFPYSSVSSASGELSLVQERFGRDAQFSVFHSLGKILHAKRDADPELIVQSSDLSGSLFPLPTHAKFSTRLYLPSQVLAAPISPPPSCVSLRFTNHGRHLTSCIGLMFSEFLHQNFIDYLPEDNIDTVLEVPTPLQTLPSPSFLLTFHFGRVLY